MPLINCCLLNGSYKLTGLAVVTCCVLVLEWRDAMETLNTNGQKKLYDYKRTNNQVTSFNQYGSGFPQNNITWNINDVIKLRPRVKLKIIPLDENEYPATDSSNIYHQIVTKYVASVPHGVYYIQIYPRHLDGVRISLPTAEFIRADNTTSSGYFVHSLGLGHNEIIIHAVDTSNIQQTFQIHVYRPLSLPAKIKKPKLCGYVQDQQFVVYKDDPVGLFKLSPKYTRGHWILNCTTCDSVVSAADCDWSGAIWKAETSNNVDDERMTRCFTSRNVLFIGDSTNRGVMYQIIEKVNGSIQEWERIHDQKQYSNVGAGNTFSFYYYPQFWLKNSPTSFNQSYFAAVVGTFFESVIKAKSPPVSEKDEILLVIGGVQWLLPSHLITLDKVVKRLNLTDTIRVVVKGYGIGFHTPGTGLDRDVTRHGSPKAYSTARMKSTKELQRLIQRQQAKLESVARQLGYAFVDTFRLTVGRWQHFYPGRCVCHFHKVLREGSRFHVHGFVNAAYSKLILNEMCKGIT